MPRTLIERREAAGDDRAAKGRISVELTAEVAKAIQEKGSPGIYLITPLNRYDVIRQVIATLKQ